MKSEEEIRARIKELNETEPNGEFNTGLKQGRLIELTWVLQE